MRDSKISHTPPRFKGKVITDQFAGQISRVQELAYILKIADVMTGNVITITPEASMQEVLTLLREKRISGIPILEDDCLIGVVSTEDLIRCLMKNDLDAPVQNYMSTRLFTVNSFDYLTEALKIFTKTGRGRLPVLNENKKLVGIITKGDVSDGLLKALEHDYQEEEVRRYRASHLFEDIESERTSLVLRYDIKHFDFANGGAASSNIKRALLRLGANAQLARRVGIGVYEAEMNMIIHASNGGSIHAEIEPTQIGIYVWDDGPGIEDVEMAMKSGFSTATQEIRDLGFGAGMGLNNISRCVDEMKIVSEVGKGTHLTLKFFLKEEDTVGEGYQSHKESEDDPRSNHSTA
jgi:CBS domain-containing protein/anti-sigma regulatory factor (Ser/Thr protein kinase)